MNSIKFKSYKINWNSIFVSVLNIGFLISSIKLFFMILYELKGWLKLLMPLIDYTKDSKYYYVLNGIMKMKYGSSVLSIGLFIDVFLIIIFLYLLLKRNASKKLLIIEHTSLPHMSFSYDKNELESYSIERLPINQYETISNNSLYMKEKVKLLISEIDTMLPKIYDYIDQKYQIGYAGIPVGNIPSVFLLGYELDDANKKIYFHKNRLNSSDDNFHILKDETRQIKLHLSKIKNKSDIDGKILVLIQLTQPIHEADLHGVLEENDYILKYEVPGNIDYDIIDSSQQTNTYAQQIVSDIAEIQKSPKISEIKICIAASSDFIFALGTKFSKTQNIDTIIYQFDKNKYSWGINITKKEPIIINEINTVEIIKSAH